MVVTEIGWLSFAVLFVGLCVLAGAWWIDFTLTRIKEELNELNGKLERKP